MKRLIGLALMIVMVSAALCSCSGNIPGEDLTADIKADENLTYIFKNGETTNPTSYNDYKTAAVNFSADMLYKLYKEDKNVTYSPAALHYQLSLLENAASGKTQSRIKSVTGDNLALDGLNSSSGYFFSRIEKLSNIEKNRYIDINGDFFLNSDTPVSQKFLLSNADFYNQGIFRLSFSDKDFTDKVNSYISEKSKAGYISAPDKNSGLMLLNSAYMSDSWLDGFKKASRGKFKGADKTSDAKFLSGTEYYLESKLAEGFVKDLKNTPAKFAAFMPKDNNIDYLLKKLNSDSFSKLMNSMSVFKTREVSIPEFTRKSDINFTERKSLRFLKETGDYSGLSYAQKSSVSDLIQSFELKITKDGIGSGSAVKSNSTKKEPEKTLNFNRPFIFAVVDNESYIPVFMGVISNI